jgi:hypothetical protein
LLPDGVCIEALDAAEHYIEGRMEELLCVDFAETFDDKRRSRFPKRRPRNEDAWTALYCTVHRRWRSYLDRDFAGKRWELLRSAVADAGEALGAGEAAVQTILLRDVIDNPFSPSVTLEQACLSPDVLALAHAAYDERALPTGELDPVRLAVLADALEEAGAASELVGHLRGPDIHVRGCWGVDRILAKE